MTMLEEELQARTKDNQKISCIILAGGRSSRLGANKALVPLNDKPLISYILDVVEYIFDDIVVVSRDELGLSTKASIVLDKSDVYSPISGVLEGIKHISNFSFFLVACDMPFIDMAVVRELLAKHDDSRDCTVAKSSKGLEPLCAVYKNKLFESAEPTQSIQSLITKSSFMPVDVPDEFVFNVNTPEELEEAERRIAQVA